MPQVFLGRKSPMANRMRRIRLAFAGNDRGAGARFAKRCGLTYTRWQNYESGYPLSLEAALQINEAFPDLTVSYLLLGHFEESVPPRTRARLNGQLVPDE